MTKRLIPMISGQPSAMPAGKPEWFVLGGSSTPELLPGEPVRRGPDVSNDKRTIYLRPGRIFARLTVLSYVNESGKGSQHWCRCQCGNIRKVKTSHLMAGTQRSCGCLRDEVARREGYKKIAGLIKARREFLCKQLRQKTPA